MNHQFDSQNYENCKQQLWKCLVRFLPVILQEDIEIKKAFDFASDAHQTKCKKEKPQRRKDGIYYEDKTPNFYFIHPVMVAVILASIGASKELIMAALLHDVVEDTTVEKEAIEIFEQTVADIVDAVTDEKVDFAKKLLKILRGGKEGMMLKFADRLNNLENPKLNLDGTLSENAVRTATETLLIHSQLAFGLGFDKIGNIMTKKCRNQLQKASQEQGKILDFGVTPINPNNFGAWLEEIKAFCSANTNLERDAFLTKLKQSSGF